MSTFATLMYGEIDEVANLIDANKLSDAEVRAVLVNLCNRVKQLEKQVFVQTTVLNDQMED